MQKIMLYMFLMSLTSCSTLYYNTWELLGKEKRDVLKMNMEDVDDQQKDVEEKVSDTLALIRKNYNFKEGKLEATYDRMKEDYEDAKSLADDYSEQVQKTIDIADDLFDEWEDEAKELSNANYRTTSLKQLRQTKASFKRSEKSMRRVENSLNKLLKSYNDQVVYLKHSLNAKAVGNLKAELSEIKRNIEILSSRIEKSKQQNLEFLNRLH